ncbi:MAG: hypothetical protein ACPG5U_08245 [Planktomarina sp.]
MKIISTRILKCHYDRDFGRVEAWVTLETQYHPSLPSRRKTVLAQADARPGKLRERIMQDARRVVVLIDKLQRWEQSGASNQKLAA